MATIEKMLTLEEFLALPDEKPALEWDNGKVTQKMPPDFLHGRLELALGRLLEQAAVPAGSLIAFTEARWTLPQHSRVPDIVLYRRERLPLDERGRLRHGEYAEPPDIAVEIISPGQIIAAQLTRCREFVAAGVVLALLVDPDRETVTIVDADSTVRTMRDDERIDLSPVLPDFAHTVAQLFSVLSFA